MKFQLLAVIGLALCVAAPNPVAAQTDTAPASQSVTAGDLEITGAFARATLPRAPVGGGFLTIANHGTVDDRLLSATTPIAGTTQIHEMQMRGDVMQMGELPDGLAIPAGQTVQFAPSGYHLMFMQLKQPLVEGTEIPLTLTFEKAGTVEVQLSVEGIAAKSPADMPAMDMKGMTK